MPFTPIRRTASYSLTPGRTPNSTLRTAVDVWQAAYSKAAS